MVLTWWKVNLRRREPCNWRESVVSTENFSLWETRELMDGGYLWRSMWILCMTSSLSSHSTSATAVSSPKCNSEKRPLSNSVAFQTLFKWHRYCGILKIHIVRKINTGIRYEPVYRPALQDTSRYISVIIKHFCPLSVEINMNWFNPNTYSTTMKMQQDISARQWSKTQPRKLSIS